MNIEMNLVSDWEDIIIQKIRREGLKFSSDTPKRRLVIRYLTYLRKKGGLHPRRVYKSKEFVCPRRYTTGLKQIIDILQNGEDLSPYLSKKVDNISEIDGMFNDWGILHLHLGERVDPKDNRYTERTGPLLFLYLTMNEAYLINIYNHGDWAKKSILQTIYNNWPDLIKPYIIKGLSGLSLQYQYSEQEQLQSRNAGSLTLVDILDLNGDTIVIIPPNLGMTTSRDAIQDVTKYQDFTGIFANLEQQISENIGQLLPVFKGKIPDPIRLKLIEEEDIFFVSEQSTGTKVMYFKIESIA